MGIRYFTNAMNFKVEDKETKKETLVGSGRNLNSNHCCPVNFKILENLAG